MKAIIYGRQSSGDDDYSESVEMQIEKCKALADKEGLKIVGIYYDNNTSGKTYPSGAEAIANMDMAFQQWYASQTVKKMYRNGLGDALKKLKDIDYLLVWDMTRLYRPFTGSFLESYMHQLFTANGTKVWTVSNGIIDFGNFNDSLIMALQNRINNEQLKTQTEKAKAALKKLKDSGEYHQGLARMYGYAPTGRKKEVEIVPEEAKMIKEIFSLFNDAWTMNKITQYVNENYPNVFDRPCHRQQIRKILLNSMYAGYMKNSEGELIKSKQLENKEIISVETWMKAYKKLDNRKSTNPRQKKRWMPLSPFIYCGQCGAKMTSKGPSHSEKKFYVCQRHLRDGKAACKNNLAVSDDIKEGIGLIEAVKPLLLAQALKSIKTSKDDAAERKRIAELEMTLSELKKKADKMTGMWTASIMDEDVYETAMKQIKEKTTEAMKEKTKLEMALSRDTSQFDLVKLMMKFRSDALTRGEYETLANLMLKKILIYRDFIEVKTVFGDVSIPRQHISRFNLICNYDIKLSKNRAIICYYTGKASLHDKRLWNEAKRIAVLGDLEVYKYE